MEGLEISGIDKFKAIGHGATGGASCHSHQWGPGSGRGVANRVAQFEPLLKDVYVFGTIRDFVTQSSLGAGMETVDRGHSKRGGAS